MTRAIQRIYCKSFNELQDLVRSVTKNNCEVYDYDLPKKCIVRYYCPEINTMWCIFMDDLYNGLQGLNLQTFKYAMQTIDGRQKILDYLNNKL